MIHQPELIIELADADQWPSAMVGHKARSLAELLRVGLPVPGGVVVTCEAHHLALGGGHPGTPANPANLATFLANQRAALDRRLSKLRSENGFIVRSSAVAEDGVNNAWPGVFESFHAVTLDEVLDRIIRCWESVNSARAQCYRDISGLSGTDGMAVLVQQRVVPQLSGVVFTADPLTGSQSNIIIEIVAGDCEGLVSGRVTPDQYVIERSSRSIVSRVLATAGRAQMAYRDLMRLFDLVMSVERLSESPIDLEWGLSNGRFWIFQRRPITTVNADGLHPFAALSVTEGDDFQHWWVDCQPLWRTHASALSVVTKKELVWNQLGCFALQVSGRLVKAYMPRSEIDRSVARGQFFVDDFDVEEMWGTLGGLLADFATFEKSVRCSDFAAMDTAGLREIFLEAVELCGTLCGHYRSTGDEETTLFGEELRHHLGAREIQRLDAALPERIFDDEHARFVELLAQRGPGQVSDAEMLEHVADFPWLAYNLHTIQDVVQNMRERAEGAAHSLDSAGVSEPEDRHAVTNFPQELMEKFALLKAFRTRIKLVLASLDFVMIPCFSEICQRSGVEMDELMSHYYVDEVLRLLNTGERIQGQELIDRRQSHLLIYQDGILRHVSGSVATEKLEEMSYPVDRREIKGQVACAGPDRRSISGEAMVLVCDDPSSVRAARERITPRHIIVTSMTQFNALDVVARAAGIITDEGGVLSHAAIMAREFKIPCIVGTRVARSVIADGAWVTMDLTRGIIRVAEASP